jgi:hypothetical protein
VIQRYIQVPQLDNLIKYLEKLIRGQGQGQVENKTEAELATMANYNKDYTALLLNCYVKKEKFQAIQEFVNQDVNKDSKALSFDVATAIEVCRQH